jgi:Transposase DNA-binding
VSTLLDDFAATHFGSARLGDKRLTQRLVLSADRIARHPEGSLPQKMGSPKKLKGLYRLVNNRKVTHRGVLQPHFDRTRQAVADCPGDCLIVHDTTEFDLTSKRSLREETGEIGTGHNYRGFHCHNSIAVTTDGQPLGLLNQILHARRRRPKGQPRATQRADPQRESRLWVRGRRAIGRFPAGKRVIDVCDRGGDSFEFLDFEHVNNYLYLVRSQFNRVCQLGHDEDGLKAKLHDHLRSLPEQGRRRLEVPPQPETKQRQARPGRVTSVAVSWAAVTLRPPSPGQARGEHRQELLRVWAVRLWEPSPPVGEEALEWLLLSNGAVHRVEQAWEKVNWYQLRWPTAEEYHKAQKTGCQIEGPQFTTGGAMKAMIGLLSVVAWLLLRLRWEAQRPDGAQKPASAVVPLEWVLALCLWRYGAPKPDLSVRDFFLALARLGGHQNRKGDGLPGWQTIWKGWSKLHTGIEFISLHDPTTCGQS